MGRSEAIKDAMMMIKAMAAAVASWGVSVLKETLADACMASMAMAA